MLGEIQCIWIKDTWAAEIKVRVFERPQKAGGELREEDRRGDGTSGKTFGQEEREPRQG